MTESDETKVSIKIIIIPAIIVISLWIIFAFLAYRQIVTGVVGDSFGSLNTLFSGLAFLGVIYAVIMQSKELEYQREELKMTREVLGEQRNEMQIQNTTHQFQNFENTFFNLLKLRQQIVDSTVLSGRKNNIEYQDKGTKVYFEYTNFYIRYLKEEKEKAGNEDSLLTLITTTNDKFDKTFGNYFLPYINNFCVILRLINDSEVIQDKELYITMLFTCLTDAEILLVLYYLLGDDLKYYNDIIVDNLAAPEVDFRNEYYKDIAEYYHVKI